MGIPKSLQGKTVFVTGGSGGLGKAISKELAARGAHITIFARREGPLEEAKKDILAARLSEDQEINAVSLDLADASNVDEAFRAQPRIADILYCSAGGNHAENGFLADIEAKDLDNCMKNNYYSSAYAAKSIIDIWTADDKKGPSESAKPQLRQIIFINSAAAFLGIPGSIAYTPAKCAVRALADTLRMEVLRYNCPASTYTIHIAFPADFVSPGFVLEQKTKTPLTKRIQGLDRPFEELEGRFPSSEKVASLVIAAVDRGDFIICEDSFSASALFTNMTGPSPKRGLGIVDSILGLLVGWVVWPVLRRRWEAMCTEDGENSRKQA
ncbi:putative short chain dehydrogenase/ reductase [Annulohypoxylon maeteangense]|uniref:putative short chain dehydrogenase/ reductase n=1 Tax=Annulohypoxylon maeteangense TaxID=1927788 RepID=UPI002007E873|nr:putative short chain dehydrogenase/ reductase [Annulohypoxylon maeteangense]KAI0889324.1 putative short chain dehydrogenase/ reductase [Annulohypoxylon maeteangense]